MGRLIAALVRHGEYHQLADTPSAHQPFPLTETGAEQARQAALLLRETTREHGWEPLSPIDSSQMLRAWQTARHIADAWPELGPDFAVEGFDTLAERGVGCAANLTLAQIEEVLRQDPRYPEPPPGWKADSHYRLPLQGAESLLQAGERVAAHLVRRMQELQREDGRDRLKLFVGHGAAMRHAAYHLGVLDFDQIARLSMYHCRPLFLEYLPDDSWRHVGGEWKIRTVADRTLD
jgi:2,3-bisphosphoglycerate-dependent phosphoglycerate mutase